MSAPAGVSHPLILDGFDTRPMGNRFLLSAIAFQRSKQLQQGAVPRVARGRHKSTYIAVLEVLADAVSWSHTGDPNEG